MTVTLLGTGKLTFTNARREIALIEASLATVKRHGICVEVSYRRFNRMIEL